MKVRNGFVSNSSSSSFIIIGCKVSEKEVIKLKEQLLGRKYKEDEDWECDACDALSENDWEFVDDNEEILGKVLESYDSYEMSSFTLQKVKDTFKEVKDRFKKEPKIYVGTKYC